MEETRYPGKGIHAESRRVLRLRFGLGLQQNQTRGSCSIGQATVHRYLEKAAAAGLSWPLPEDLDDRRLEELLFPAPVGRPNQFTRPLPDFGEVLAAVAGVQAPEPAVGLRGIPGAAAWECLRLEKLYWRLRLRPLASEPFSSRRFLPKREKCILKRSLDRQLLLD